MANVRGSSPSNSKLPVLEGPGPYRDGRSTPRGTVELNSIREWLKGIVRSIYGKAVYCQACGYEIGTNPECAVCAKTMKRP